MKVCFFDPSCDLKTIDDLKTNPRGGMVSSLFKVTDYLSGNGHQVMVCTSIEKPGITNSGVFWTNQLPVKTDVLVINRGTQGGLQGVDAKARIVWTHDLPHDGFCPDRRAWGAINCVVFMSFYAERIWRAYYPEIRDSMQIPNGVDFSLFHPREKDPHYLIYASAPNRGLAKLPVILESIQEATQEPYYLNAFSSMAVLHPHESEGWTDDRYESVKNSKVTLKLPIPQTELAEELGKASMMVIPNDYPEICSNTILQSLASGTPVVTTGNCGSAGEWIRHGVNGLLTVWQPRDYMIYTLEMVRDIMGVLKNKKALKKMQERAAKSRILSWDQVGEKWLRLINHYA